MSNRMMIYLLIIPDPVWGNKENLLINHVSLSRQQRINNYKYVEDKLLSLYGELVLRKAILERLSCRNEEIFFLANRYGKPFLPGHKDICFNMSHTRNALVCGISNKEIGVDIEKRTLKYQDLLTRSYLHDEEVAYINTGSLKNDDSAFSRIWTRKEAYAKQLGCGLNMDLKGFSVLQPDIQNHFMTKEHDDYVFSAYSEGKIDNSTTTELTLEDIHQFFSL